jgi:type II secretory pathway pseudopilin PulG
MTRTITARSHRSVDGRDLDLPNGYMLLELLVAAALVCTVIAVLLRFCATAQASVRTAGDSTDLEQRLRVAVEAIRRDLLGAGAGLSNGSPRGPLIDAFPPILPARTGLTGSDPDALFFTDRITLLSVPDDGAQTRLTNVMGGPAGPLVIDPGAPGCASDGTCGFRAGDRILIYAPEAGDGARDIVTLSAVDAASASLVPAAALSRAYAAGTRVATLLQRVYYLDRAGKRLMVYDGDRSDVPVVDHVVDLRFTYYGDPSPTSVTPPAEGLPNCAYAAGRPPVPLLSDLGGTKLVPLTEAQLTDGPWCGQSPGRFDVDLLRVRRIGVALRLEAEGAEFRGTGAAFATRGTSLVGDRYIPDVQITFDVAPRNLLNTGMR